MRFRADSWLVPSIALVVVLLWAVAAPASLGGELLEDGWDGLPQWDEEVPAVDSILVPWDIDPEIDGILEAAGCPGLPDEAPAEVAPIPEPFTDPPPDRQQPSDPSPATTGSYLMCGDPDPLAEQAIEQLIAGRSFSSRLISRPDGCADLTIAVPPQSSPGSFIGRQSVGLTVTAGSGSGAPRRSISVRITTENGTTRASIGAAR